MVLPMVIQNTQKENVVFLCLGIKLRSVNVKKSVKKDTVNFINGRVSMPRQ